MLGKYEYEVLYIMPPDEFMRWNALIEMETREEARRDAALARQQQQRRP